ncbi:hypothetical protein PT974_01980 [Cladobotryum mycophilum]|uniref:HNH nuclease domain-containing protein n=1 Tax=Cladobotryum mycophilum TaxID=491253 RepID=A0ABR0SWW2_9HYPO
MEGEQQSQQAGPTSSMDDELPSKLYDAYQRDPRFREYVADIPVTEPVLDYVTEVEVRLEIVREVQLLCHGVPRFQLTAPMFAVFMIAPLDQLRITVDKLRNDPPEMQEDDQSDIRDRTVTVPFFDFFSTYSSQTVHDAIRSYIPRGGRPRGSGSVTPINTESPLSSRQHQRSTSSPTIQGHYTLSEASAQGESLSLPRSPRARSGEAVSKCKIRDGNVCIVAGTSDPEAAHIFPFATSFKMAFSNLNMLLKMFWGFDTYERWSRQYQSSGIIESPKNLLSFNHQLHFWWDHSKFALKPLRQTGNSIIVQWHWLKRPSLKMNQVIPHNANLRDYIDPQGWGDNFFLRKSGRVVETGQLFTIHAANPDHLPSFELLELQWDLLRIAAICGAAEAYDEALDYDSEDDDFALSYHAQEESLFDNELEC